MAETKKKKPVAESDRSERLGQAPSNLAMGLFINVSGRAWVVFIHVLRQEFNAQQQ
jgi:hypothetical protein